MRGYSRMQEHPSWANYYRQRPWVRKISQEEWENIFKKKGYKNDNKEVRDRMGSISLSWEEKREVDSNA